MKFNRLNVPTHWQNYWTRYPEGHTILEALIQWVSQVDEMVDNQNKLNDNVEQFRSEIDDFIGKFDERLQDEVTDTLNDWQRSGFLDVVISTALEWQLDDYIKTNEQDKQSIKTDLARKANQIDVNNKFGELGAVATFKGSATNSQILAKTGMQAGDEWYDTTNQTSLRWNGTSWIDVGATSKVGKGTITLNNLSFTSVVSKNRFDLTSAELGRLVEDGTVADNATTTYYTSDFMRFNPNEVVTTNFNLQSSAVYDINMKKLASTIDTVHSQITMPSNGYYLKVTRPADRIDEFMVVSGEMPTTYDPFRRVIEGRHISNINGEDINNNSISDEKLSFITEGNNLFNPENIIKGVYLNPENGALQTNTAYNTTTIIEASPNETYTITHPRFIVFFGQDGKFIPSVSISLDSPPANYTFTLPSNAYGYQYSYLARNTDMQIVKGDVATPYEPYFKALDGVSVKPSNIIEYGEKVTKSSSTGDLADGQRLVAGSANSLKKNKTYSFSANITSYFGLRMGQGEKDYGGSYVEITASELKFFDYRGTVTPRAVLTHGLTIANFIDVLITIDKDANAIVRIMTNGGFYESAPQKWEGYNGTPFAKSMGSVLTEGEFVFDTSDFDKPIYFFGDSYAGLTAKDRWVNYIREWGFDNWLINGYPGQASLSAKGMLDFVLSKGNPDILIWGLGMNDGDTSTAVNSNWLNTYNQIKTICESRDIELVLCTIPNTPSINNSFKNNIIRNSGYRYIDFAKAVGAEEVGSNWYTGMLSGDNIHPAILGAQKLALRAIGDVPELAK